MLVLFLEIVMKWDIVKNNDHYEREQNLFSFSVRINTSRTICLHFPWDRWCDIVPCEIITYNYNVTDLTVHWSVRRSLCGESVPNNARSLLATQTVVLLPVLPSVQTGEKLQGDILLGIIKGDSILG